MTTQHTTWKDQVVYEIEAEFDDIPIRGNAIVSGDDELDREVEDELIERVNNGDVWAWASVKVTASIPGIDLEGVDYLGGCSYWDEKDFKQGGYYEGMKERALEDLEKQIQAVFNLLPREG